MKHDLEVEAIKSKSTMQCEVTVVDVRSRRYVKYAFIPLLLGLIAILLYLYCDFSDKWNEILKIIISVVLGVSGTIFVYFLARKAKKIPPKNK